MNGRNLNISYWLRIVPSNEHEKECHFFVEWLLTNQGLLSTDLFSFEENELI